VRRTPWPALLRGSVKVTTGLASDDLVPVHITMALTEGEVFVTSESADADRGSVSVALRNGTESTLRIAALPAWIKCGAQITEARLDGLNLAAPVDLAANDQLKFTALPLVPLTAAETPDVIFDISAVQPLPEPQTPLPLILDRAIAQEKRTPVEVVTSPELLAGDRPQNAVSMVGIEFKGNVNVMLDATTLHRKVAVPVPLTDWLFGRDTAGFYGYRQTIVRKDGRTETSDWRTDDAGLLVVPKS
jgi:hypothetical protein